MYVVYDLFPFLHENFLLNWGREAPLCVSIRYSWQRSGASSFRPSTISAAAAALLALAEWFLLLLLFRRRFGLEDGYQSSPELVLAARARPPSPFFACLSGEGGDRE